MHTLSKKKIEVVMIHFKAFLENFNKQRENTTLKLIRNRLQVLAGFSIGRCHIRKHVV